MKPNKEQTPNETEPINPIDDLKIGNSIPIFCEEPECEEGIVVLSRFFTSEQGNFIELRCLDCGKFRYLQITGEVLIQEEPSKTSKPTPGYLQ